MKQLPDEARCRARFEDRRSGRYSINGKGAGRSVQYRTKRCARAATHNGYCWQHQHEKDVTIKPKQHLGLVGSNPATGECIAAFATTPAAEEQADLIAAGTMFERKPLAEVKDAFCEVHPSRRVSVRGPSVGQYRDSDIPAWIEMADGMRYEYAGICGAVVDFSTLAEGQLALAPGLIYQPMTA